MSRYSQSQQQRYKTDVYNNNDGHSHKSHKKSGDTNDKKIPADLIFILSLRVSNL